MGSEGFVFQLTVRQAGLIAAALAFTVFVVAYLAGSKPLIAMSSLNLIITIFLAKILMKG